MAVPADLVLVAEFQDNRGFRALTRMKVAFIPDISNAGGALSQLSVATLFAAIASGASSIFGRLASMSNAKIVRQAFQFDFNIAQEPSSETGTYQLVQDKAHLEFGDGNGGFFSLSIPAPADGLFLTSADNNKIVVDPAATLLTNLQAAIVASTAQPAVTATTFNFGGATPRGGTYGSQFFGGQYQGKRSRRRRVLQGQ